MRIFSNCKSMLNETVRELFARGQSVKDKTIQGKIVTDKGYDQREIIGYSYRLNKFDDIDEMMNLAKKYFNKEHLEPEFGKAWFDDMIHNPTLRDTWWEKSKDLSAYWKEFGLNKYDNFDYSYGERLICQLDKLIERLKGNLYSRGAQITVWYPKDIGMIGKRVPCSTVFQFLARKTVDNGDQLNMILTQRSCDTINFFTLDVYKAVLLLKHIAKEIDVNVGYLIHNIGSLHCYAKDVPKDRTW